MCSVDIVAMIVLTGQKFKYEGRELRCDGYSHMLYFPEEYSLMTKYNLVLRNVESEIGVGMYGLEKWTEENIKRLNMILELAQAIKA